MMKLFNALGSVNLFKSLMLVTVFALLGTLKVQASHLSQDDAATRLGHSVKVKVLYFEKSKWQLSDLENKYAHVQRFFSECDLHVDVEFVRQKNIFTHPVVFPGSENLPSSQDFAENLPHLENTIYMIHVDELADENGEFIQGISAPQARYGANHSLVHKNWVAFPSPAMSVITNIQNGLVEAHELAHDLIDSDHVEESGNILTKYVSTWKISNEQCKKVRLHPKVNILNFAN